MSIASRPSRRWRFIVEIAGLPWRYCSHPATGSPAAIQNHPGGATYTDIPAVTDISAITSRIDLAGGIAEHGSVTVTLARLPGHTADPAEVLSAVGVKSATKFAQATGSLPVDADLPFDLTIDRDLSALALPGVVHIGGEAVYVTEAKGSSADPDSVDPYYIRITARAVGGTRQRAHVALLERGDQPLITAPEVVHWRTRPARLLVEDLSRPGSAAIEVFRGFIDSTPSPKARSTTVVLELVPLTGLLDKDAKIRAPASMSRLVEGYHLFAAGTGSVFEVYQRMPELRGGVREQTAEDSNVLDVDADDAARWAESFDPDRLFEHPRSGAVIIGGRGRAYFVTGTAVDGGAVAESLTLADGPDRRVDTWLGWAVREGAETKRAVIVAPGDPPTLLVWPGTSVEGLDGAFGRINDALDVVDHTGVDGAPFGIRLDPSMSDRVLRMRRNVARTLAPVRPVITFEGDVAGEDPGVRRYVHRPIAALWPSDELGPRPARWPDNVGPTASADTRLALHYPLRWARPRQQSRVVDGAVAGTRFVSHRAGARPEDWSPAEIAAGWYQRGEPYLLVEDDLDITDGRIAVRIGQRVFAVEVDAIDPVVIAVGERAGDTVYRVTLARPDDVPSFGVWAGGDAVEVFGGAEAEALLSARESAGSTVGEALEWLLMSPSMLGLTADDVDVDSLHRYAAPWLPTFTLGGISADPDLTYADVVSSILRMTGTALIMRVTDGRCRLTRTHVGIEVATEAAGRIDAGDWAVDPAPDWDRDDDLINEVVVRHGWGLGDEPADFVDDVRFSDRASITAHDETSSVTIDDYSGIAFGSPEFDLLAMSQRIFRTFANPRRTWVGRVGTYKGVALGVGAVAIVSSPRLRAYKAGPVLDAAARVVEQRLDLWRDGCDLTLVHFSASGSGWAPSARVSEVVNVTTVKVDANAYSDAINPISGRTQQDLDFFNAGDVVKCEPYFDHDGGVTRTISSIDRAARQVVFDGAHGLAVGDSVIPTSRGSASAVHRLYAFLGDGEADVQELV